MERWFLAGAITGLIILLFDKPLANDIIGQVTSQPMATAPLSVTDKILPSNSASTDCGCADAATANYSPSIAAPLSPSQVLLPPAQPIQTAQQLYVPPAQQLRNTTQQLGNAVKR